jgi:hypothetical protein
MDNPVSLSELEKALDDLIMETAAPPLADGDITINSLAKRAHCHTQKAHEMLAEWTAAGKVEFLGKRRVPSGHRVDAWRLKGKA